MSTVAPIDYLDRTVESTNALRRRITRMGSKATTTKLAEALGVEREALQQRLEADPMFTKDRSRWRVARFAPAGTVVRCAYWGYVFRVVSQQPGPLGSDDITVEMLDHELTSNTYRPGHPAYTGSRHVVGSVWSHGTAIGERDEILALPAEH
jgi:hypothetical protein